jgi:hypothetical protein
MAYAGVNFSILYLLFCRDPGLNLTMSWLVRVFHNSARNTVFTHGGKLPCKLYIFTFLAPVSFCFCFLFFRSGCSVSFLSVFLSAVRDPRFGSLANLKPI